MHLEWETERLDLCILKRQMGKVRSAIKELWIDHDHSY